jgi:hypothetical protein
MNLTDDLLRHALRETASEIPANRVPAIDLTASRAAGHSSHHVLLSRSRWLTAVAAAAAVAAVIAGSAVLAAGNFGRPRPSRVPPLTFSGQPRFYAVLGAAHGSQPSSLIIRDVRTGATLATARPPEHWSYVKVTAAANDTTFVIGAVRMQAVSSTLAGLTSFFLARFDPARGRLTVRALPIPALTPTGIALSPDGSALAVALRAGSGDVSASGELRLYSLTTGAVKVWTTSGVVDQSSGEQGLSWGPHGILAFDWNRSATTDPADEGIWLLNTNAPAGSLMRASQLAARQAQPDGFVLQGAFSLIDNGTAVVSVAERALSTHGGVHSEYEVLSTSTGQVIRAFLPSAYYDEALWWASPAGNVLAGYLPQSSARSSGPAEWFSGAKHAPIEGLSEVPQDIAF